MNNTRVGWMTWIAAFLVVIATMLGGVTAGDRALDMDLSFARWIQQWQGNLPEALESIGDMSGEAATAIVAVTGAIAIAAHLRAWRMFAFFVIVGILRVIGTILKPIFESPRPDSSQLRIHEYSDGFGYPSGHSMTAAMIATMVMVIAWNTPATRRVRWMVTGLAVALTLLVGWSRMWSGAHWPTDVIGGWSYGVGLVLLAWAITTRVANSQTG